MFEQLKVLSNRLDELNILLADPAVIADQGRYLRLVQEHADLDVAPGVGIDHIRDPRIA